MNIFYLLLSLNLVTLSNQLHQSSSSDSIYSHFDEKFLVNPTLELRNSPSSFLLHFEEAWKIHLTLNHSDQTESSSLKSLIKTDSQFLLGQIRLFEEVFDDDSQQLRDCYIVLMGIAFDFLHLESLHFIENCKDQKESLESIQKAFDWRVETVKRLVQKHSFEDSKVCINVYHNEQQYFMAWNIGRLWNLNQLAENASKKLLENQSSSLDEAIFAFHLLNAIEHLQKAILEFSLWNAKESIQKIQFSSNLLYQSTFLMQFPCFNEIKNIADSLTPCNFWHTF